MHASSVRGSYVGLVGCRIRLKIEAGCGIWGILKTGYRMKIGGQDRYMFRFEDRIRNRKGTGRIII